MWDLILRRLQHPRDRLTPIATITCLVVAVTSRAFSGAARAEDERFDSRNEIRATIKVLEKQHLRRGVIDDELAQKWFSAFLARLDPRRMYFLASDIAELRQVQQRLDALAREGDFQFAKSVRARYRTRVASAVEYAREFLPVEHDYSLDEEIPVQFPDYAADDDELRARWRLRIKAELMIEKLHGRPRSDVELQLDGRYRRIDGQAEQMTDERLCDIYLNALTSSFDVQSTYLSPSYLSMFFRGHVKAYRLGLRLQQRAGEWMVVSLDPSLSDLKAQRTLVGWNLIAIRRIDGPTYDSVEMAPEDVDQLIDSPLRALDLDTEIILELMNPVTLERVTMTWPRFRSH